MYNYLLLADNTANYLGWDANEQKPFLFGICAVVDDLASRQAGMAVKDFYRLWVSLHTPVVHSIVSHKCNSVQGDPLPEGNIICHGMRLHLALHFNVKNLKSFGG